MIEPAASEISYVLCFFQYTFKNSCMLFLIPNYCRAVKAKCDNILNCTPKHNFLETQYQAVQTLTSSHTTDMTKTVSYLPQCVQ